MGEYYGGETALVGSGNFISNNPNFSYWFDMGRSSLPSHPESCLVNQTTPTKPVILACFKKN